MLRRLHGSKCAASDWLPFEEPLTIGHRVEMAPADGRSSCGASPFYTLDLGGAGAVVGVGWSGRWSGSVWRSPGNVCLSAGIEQTHLRLRPGETIRGPRILLVQWSGGDHERGENLFRRAMVAHVVPRDGDHPRFPPIVHLSTSFYEMNDSTEANTLSHLDPIRGLGFEYFWLDAYWTRGGFPDGMGNYGLPLDRVEPPDRFPHGLRPIGDAARREGMGFVVWFEPERVAPNTHIAREHLEWVISPNGKPGGLLNLGLPEARKYMTRYLIEAIRAYGITCMRIDFNIDPLPFWRYLDAMDPERAGIAEIRYIEGLYRMWDDVLRAHPGLFIDNCSSGGRRIDLETCARSIPLWRTDATIDPLMKHDFHQSALQNQVMTAGLSRYVPFSVSGQMGAGTV